MRVRMIKPGFYENEILAECSIWARYIFPGLWMIADSQGRLEDRPKRIKATLLPYDSQEVEPLLDELAAHGFILRYSDHAGQYIQILHFDRHQRPHANEASSVIPVPPKNEGLATLDNQGNPKREGLANLDCQSEQGFALDININTNTNTDTRYLPSEDLSGLSPDPAGLGEAKATAKPEKPNPNPEHPNPKPKNGHAVRTVAPYLQEAESVLKYLNRAVSRDYRMRQPNGKLTANAELVISRLKDGYTALQLREVVFYKADEWRDDDKMRQYLRPETLFKKRNFEQYLGAIPPEESS